MIKKMSKQQTLLQKMLAKYKIINTMVKKSGKPLFFWLKKIEV